MSSQLTKKKKLKTRKERDKKRNSLGDKSNQRLKEGKTPEKNDGSGKIRAVVEKKEEVEKKPSTPKLKDKEKSDKVRRFYKFLFCRNGFLGLREIGEVCVD